MDKRILLAAGAVVTAVVLFLVLRPGGGDEDAARSANTTEQTTTETTETATTETTETGTTTQGPPPPSELRIVYSNGRIRGGVERFSVREGESVVVVVRSDVEDEVHVHGYDLMAAVAPGRRARISFRATIPGSFEIELEDRHALLAELEVEP